MSSIDVSRLPQEVRDTIELKEGTDPTFNRFVDYDYTDIFWTMLAERADPGTEHSFIGSIFGTQGCHCGGTKITTKRGLVDIEKIVVGDEVWTRGGWKRCIPIHQGVKKTMKIILHNKQEFRMTLDHVMEVKRGWIAAKDIVCGDVFVSGSIQWSNEWNEDSERAAVVAMLLADGHLDMDVVGQKYDYERVSERVMKNIPKERHEWVRKRVRFYNSDDSLRRFMCDMLRKHFCATATGEYNDYGTVSTKVVCIQNERVCDALVNVGVLVGKKSNIVEIPEWIQKNDAAMNGFLAGYFACDGSFYAKGVEISTTSQQMAIQLQSWLQSRGCIVTVVICKKGDNHSDVYRVLLRQWDSLKMWIDHVPNISDTKKAILRKQDDIQHVKYSDDIIKEWWRLKNSGLTYQRISDDVGVDYSVVWMAMNNWKNGVRGKKGVRKNGMVDSLLTVEHIEEGVDEEVFDIHVEDIHEYLANGLISSNSGKSFLGIAVCSYLDPTFNINRIFFSYNDLVYARNSLKPNTAVLVDEQQQTYGLDAHRVMIILSSLKEQLRKRSISFIFCAPVLYEESKTSMYQIEVMFINYAEQETYAALKTRDGLTLGHIIVPHPLKILEDGRPLANKELLDAYQLKKDKHLEKLLGQSNQDDFEDRANAVMQSKLFKMAEAIYVKQMQYIPMQTLIQIVNKVFPEFHAGVMSVEIAGRIKLNKELTGQWAVAGKAPTRKDRSFSGGMKRR